ncbi:thiosulfate sulfurtransferase [Litorivivens lipolytica]|uniref:Thiosulfate sulfurtransferase n=1 Tax=Litorivivens lipolytica TaxID=1524264 RepID=A0A7W4W4S3_9GAMM|nr:thiosulfate sulfurtransferase GlpE [Litorivivens lipolytica]MBB3047394.1 thiosulfate sulfurtransferase [Litorivivens lipolytica]
MTTPAFKRISVADAQNLLNEQTCTLADIRDGQSYAMSHVPGAAHLDGNSVEEFLKEANREQPLIIYCYHGNSSQSAAQYFAEQGFAEVYSIDGGFEVWRQQL